VVSTLLFHSVLYCSTVVYARYETVREVHTRRFNLRDCAMEIFLLDHATNFFVTFTDRAARDDAFRTIQTANPPNLMYVALQPFVNSVSVSLCSVVLYSFYSLLSLCT
jgi:hypothetical protein